MGLSILILSSHSYYYDSLNPHLATSIEPDLNTRFLKEKCLNSQLKVYTFVLTVAILNMLHIP